MTRLRTVGCPTACLQGQGESAPMALLEGRFRAQPQTGPTLQEPRTVPRMQAQLLRVSVDR